MSTQVRRYVFIDYESLKKIKFKKLEKVCDKIFVLVDSSEQTIPLSLAINMQRIGKGVKWISVHKPKGQDSNYHICLLLGMIHKKVNKDIEFAIVSNEKRFDPIVNFINGLGRSCLRVKSKKSKKDKGSVVDTPIKSDIEKGKKSDNGSLPFYQETVNNNEILIEETANETVERLKYSGNRPLEVLNLRNYILLHNQEMTKNGNADRIIDVLLEKNKIEIEKGIVKYNF